MRRPAFGVVSGAVTVLVILGFVSRWLRPYIPQPVENSLGQESSEFLHRAAVQRIDWRKPTPESFMEARRRDKPIFLFIGSSSNAFAQDLDAGVFMSAQVQSYLARNFLCIRVDTYAFPEFRNAYLPLSRVAVNLLPGFQIWILDPSGKLLDLIRRDVALYGNDENSFVSALVRARRKFEDQRPIPGQPSLDEIQRENLQALRAPSAPMPPPFSDYTAALVQQSDDKNGGFKNGGVKIIEPEAWRVLLLSGRVQEVQACFDPVLRAPAVDLIDGGFFQVSRSDDWTQIEYGKTAIGNAAMLRLLVCASAMVPNPIYRWMAQRTFDSILDEFTGEDSLFACRVAQRNPGGRSDRASFGVRKLREALPDDADRTWAQEQLGLIVESNPRMVPRLMDPSILESDANRFKAILQKLREHTGKRPAGTADGYLDVTAFATARLIHAARAMGDPARLEKALALYDFLARFRNFDDVTHCDEAGLRTGNLGDYLGYADASLQHYLATGRYDSLLSGRAVLKRALFLFKNPTTGVLNIATPRQKPLPDDLVTPELADPLSESTTAMAIRICQDYARILASSDAVLASYLRSTANRLTGLYGQDAMGLAQSSAGFFCAAASVFDDAFVVTTGKNAQALADKVLRRVPSRLVVPAFGDLRQDLQKKGAGAYIVRGPQVVGPMSAADAATKLSPFLSVGGGP